MSIKVEDYFARATFQKMKAFADQQETPFVVIDTETISRSYDDLVNNFPFAKIYYAVKANPAVEIIDLLQGQGFELRHRLDLRAGQGAWRRGVSAERISYGNTIKKARDVRYFYEKGVRLFATDSEADLRNIAKAAPGSKIYVRILTEGSRLGRLAAVAQVRLPDPTWRMDLLILAKQLGLGALRHLLPRRLPAARYRRRGTRPSPRSR